MALGCVVAAGAVLLSHGGGSRLALAAAGLRRPEGVFALWGDRLTADSAVSSTLPPATFQGVGDTTKPDLPTAVTPSVALPSITMTDPPGNKGDGGRD